MSIKINYGIDTQGVVRFFFAAGLVAFALCLIITLWLGLSALWLALPFGVLSFATTYLTIMGCRPH